VSQRAYKSLVDILSLVCAAYFTVKLSRYTIDRVLCMEQPHYERYIVCPNDRCRQLYDWCPTCGLTWPYVHPVPAHVCPPAAPPAAAAPLVAAAVGDELKQASPDDAKRGAKGRKADENQRCRKEEERRRLGQICLHVRYPDHRTAAHMGFCNTWLFKELDRPPAPREDGTPPRAPGGKDKKKDKLRSHGIVPCLIYCYRPVSKRLAQLLCRPGVEEQCEEWRTRLASTPPGVMTDIIQGRIWRKFQHLRDPATGRRDLPFLAAPHNLAFTINVDWVQPYLHVVYSVGVIYLTVNNLPRSVRFQRDNMLIVGVIPGGNEKELNLDPFLAPLVDELLRMRPSGPGVRIQTALHPAGVAVRAAIIAVVSDMPASRKVSGFAGHSADKGCTRCELNWCDHGDEKRDDAPPPAPKPKPKPKLFSRPPRPPGVLALQLARCERRMAEEKEAKLVQRAGSEALVAAARVVLKEAKANAALIKQRNEQRRADKEAKRASEPLDDDIGSDGDELRRRRSWLRDRRRRHGNDRAAALAWSMGTCKAERDRVKRYTGVVGTSLLRLDYFRPARMTLADPMHQVYMGIGKRLLHELQSERWSKPTLLRMQQLLDAMPIPSDVCRILNKWASKMSDLNASQLKVFITSLSTAVFRADASGIDDDDTSEVQADDPGDDDDEEEEVKGKPPKKKKKAAGAEKKQEKEKQPWTTEEQRQMWTHLVKACRILSSPYVCTTSAPPRDYRARPLRRPRARSGIGLAAGPQADGPDAVSDDSDSRDEEETPEEQQKQSLPQHRDDIASVGTQPRPSVFASLRSSRPSLLMLTSLPFPPSFLPLPPSPIRPPSVPHPFPSSTIFFL